MASVQVAVEPRQITGKKVKALRRKGIIPAHLYGKDTDSLSLQAAATTVGSLLRAAERNQIIDLQIDGEAQARPVMLRGVQRNPVTDELVHVDFIQIDLTATLSADVPLNFIGEAPAVHVFGGILLHVINHVTVKALPADLPSHIDVDISGLETLEAALHVRDLALPPNVDMLTDADQVIAKVSPPRVAEEEAAPAAAEAEAGAPAEGEAAAAPAAEGAKEPESAG